VAFGRIGEIRDVYIPRDYHSNQPKGFAFIEYATPAMAAEARNEMDRFVVRGRELEVVFAQERRKTPNEMRGRVVNQQNHQSPEPSPRASRERSSSFERHRLREQHVDGGGSNGDNNNNSDKEDK
jgi:RNA recognition motif-containing protein